MPDHAESFVEIYGIASEILYNIDAGNLDAVMADMTDDVTMILGDSKAVGIEQVRAAIQASLAEEGASKHMLTNLRVKPQTERSWKVCSTIIVTVARPGRRAVTTCEYEDEFVREDNGMKLSTRTMSVSNSLVL